MKNIARILMTAFFVLSANNNAMACALDGSSGFMPENNLRIPVGQKSANQMTKEQFERIVSEISDLYTPIARKSGGWLKINANWDDATVNAYATRFWKFWRVNMYGGLARHKDMTADGFALVVCHELGHHLAGSPSSSWASAEGQSDYYATTKCARMIWEKQDNESVIANMSVPASVSTNCEQQYANTRDIALCKRAAMGGLSLARVLGSLGSSPEVSFTTPDPTVVTRTNTAHPKAQCRLDTYWSGALCDRDHYQSPSDNDEFTGYCNTFEGDTTGVRPLCWYKPSK